MDEDRSSKPLFEKNDVRHSVGTVEERWGREMTRRRRLMARTVLPFFIVLLVTWLTISWFTKSFPFRLSYEEQIEEYLNSKKGPDIDGPLRTMGYPDAKMKVKIIVASGAPTPEEWQKYIMDLIDIKPSEVYLEVWPVKNVSDAEKKLMKVGDPVCFNGIFINGEHSFTYTNRKGEEVKLNTIVPPGDEAMGLDVIDFLNFKYNEIYSKIYGIEEKPLEDKKLEKQMESEKASMERQRLPEVLPTMDASELKKKQEENVEVKLDDAILLPKFNMKVDTVK